mmetsp:Transcript_6191/g.11072  ORF Transcript_6191/g.11072 Transcript_6191/m.11072 type:complete len:444 (-) Transcript_6191:73-1404(-)
MGFHLAYDSIAEALFQDARGIETLGRDGFVADAVRIPELPEGTSQSRTFFGATSSSVITVDRQEADGTTTRFCSRTAVQAKTSWVTAEDSGQAGASSLQLLSRTWHADAMSWGRNEESWEQVPQSDDRDGSDQIQGAPERVRPGAELAEPSEVSEDDEEQQEGLEDVQALRRQTALVLRQSVESGRIAELVAKSKGRRRQAWKEDSAEEDVKGMVEKQEVASAQSFNRSTAGLLSQGTSTSDRSQITRGGSHEHWLVMTSVSHEASLKASWVVSPSRIGQGSYGRVNFGESSINSVPEETPPSGVPQAPPSPPRRAHSALELLASVRAKSISSAARVGLADPRGRRKRRRKESQQAPVFIRLPPLVVEHHHVHRHMHRHHHEELQGDEMLRAAFQAEPPAEPPPPFERSASLPSLPLLQHQRPSPPKRAWKSGQPLVLPDLGN